MNKINLKKILSISVLSLVMVLGYQNCGDSAGNGYRVDGSGSSNPLVDNRDLPAPGGNGDIVALAETRTASIVSANRTLDSMVSCLGAVSASNAAREAYNANKGSLSVEGSANSVTTPMLAAFTKIAAEVCNDVIGQESGMGAGQRRLFNSVDFNSGPSANTGAIGDVAARISRSCWGREATAAEVSMIQTSINQAYGNNNNAQDTREQMVFLCAGMVGAFAAVEM